MDSTYATGLDHRNEPYIRCLICHKDSFDQADIDNAYCANCDLMHNEGRKRNRRDVIEYQLRQAFDKDFELRFVSLGESTEQNSFWKEAQKTCPCGGLGSSALWTVFFVATTAFAVCTMFGALIGELVAKDSTRGLFYGALAGVLIDMVGLSLIFRQFNDTGKKGVSMTAEKRKGPELGDIGFLAFLMVVAFVVAALFVCFFGGCLWTMGYIVSFEPVVGGAGIVGSVAATLLATLVLWAKPWEVRQQSTNKEDSA